MRELSGDDCERLNLGIWLEPGGTILVTEIGWEIRESLA